MNSISHTRAGGMAKHRRAEQESHNSAAIASLVLLSVTAAAAAYLFDAYLFLPVMALASTVFAITAAITAAIVATARQACWLTSVGVFALAAVTASMTGDPSAILDIGR
ncbi:MAG: hypothetical protein FJX29_00290 [Alphaproteobacteria bacterium]|nr:hypothetical protein [Alphaproteobacteria bacterium]